MAQIEDPVLIASLSDQIKLRFPVRPHLEQDTVVVTTSRNTVSLIKVRDAKPYKSWSMPQNRPFTSPVVMDHDNAKLVSVENNNVIRQWEPDADTITTAVKNEVVSQVCEILSLPKREPLVVFTNGCCHLLSRALVVEETDACVIADETILRSEATEDEGLIHVVHHVATNKKIRKPVFYYLKVSSESETVFMKRAELDIDSTTLVSWCLAKDAPGSPLLVLLTSGEIRSYTTDFETFTVVCSLPLQSRLVSFRSLDASHIMLLATQENEFSVLELWDVNFKVLKKRKKLDFLLHYSTQMNVIGSGLCLVSDNQVLFCSFETGSLLLSSSVGRFSTDLSSEVSRGFSWGSDGTVVEEDIDFQSKTTPLICKEIFDDLLERKDCSGIIDALHQSKDIPEAQLLRVLNFFLGLEKVNLKKKFVKVDLSEVVSEEKAYCLSQVLRLPYNDVFLHHHLQNLPSDRAQLLLKFLNDCLKSCRLNFDSQDHLSVIQVANWISLLIDVHYNSLTMTTDRNVQDFLLELSQTVDKTNEFYEEMDSVAQLIQVVSKGFELPRFQNKGQYQIEVLEI